MTLSEDALLRDLCQFDRHHAVGKSAEEDKHELD